MASLLFIQSNPMSPMILVILETFNMSEKYHRLQYTCKYLKVDEMILFDEMINFAHKFFIAAIQGCFILFYLKN